MGWSDRLQRMLLSGGWVVSAFLLIRFAIDFSREMPLWLAMPFCLLVAAAVWLARANAVSSYLSDRDASRRSTVHLLLLAVIPVAFLASSLDCTGLSLHGCSPFCTFVKLVWVPLIAIACLMYFFSGRQVLLAAITLVSFVPLAPHCICYNVGNAWWIDHIGVSPLCYGWGFVASIIAVGSLRSGVRLRSSLLVCSAIIAGSIAFFATHHYFHFPW